MPSTMLGTSLPRSDLILKKEDIISVLETRCKDFPGGPVVQSPPSNVEDLGLILGQGTETPHATGKLLDNKEPMCYNEDPLQRGKKKEKK